LYRVGSPRSGAALGRRALSLAVGKCYPGGMSIAADAKLVCPKEVLSRVLAGEAVLLHLGSGLYFGMNDVASRAWERIVEGATFGDVLSTLVTEFDVNEETARTDLESFVGALVDKELVRVESPPAA